MAITIIDRIEQKYFLSKKQYENLIKDIDFYLVKDEYFRETICNVFFDNDNYELISNSIMKPAYKEKVRLRSYNTPHNKDIVFLEIKKKYLGKVNKRRIEITYEEAKDYIYNHKLPNANKQILSEIDYAFNKYKLKPKITLSYDRTSYTTKEDKNFRITFDNNIRYRNQDIYLEEIKNGNNLINDNYIMEIKTNKAIPRWLLDALEKNNIYPTSFSKIGNAYIKIRESE